MKPNVPNLALGVPRSQAPARFESSGTASGRTVLVVEDHDDTRNSLALLLMAAGYVVHTAEDGAAALDVLQLHPECGLVILDWRLPDMDGGDVLRAVRGELQLADLPIIVLSADALDAENVHAAGATALLRKPEAAHVLLGVIARHLPPDEQLARL